MDSTVSEESAQFLNAAATAAAAALFLLCSVFSLLFFCRFVELRGGFLLFVLLFRERIDFMCNVYGYSHAFFMHEVSCYCFYEISYFNL